MEHSKKSANCNFDARSKDSFVLKFIMKLNVFNPSFMKNKSRFRKENETTCENVTSLDIAARNQKIHHVN